MSPFLDKSITLRQLFKYGRWFVYIAAPLYVAALFFKRLQVENGRGDFEQLAVHRPNSA